MLMNWKNLSKGLDQLESSVLHLAVCGMHLLLVQQDLSFRGHNQYAASGEAEGGNFLSANKLVNLYSVLKELAHLSEGKVKYLIYDTVHILKW